MIRSALAATGVGALVVPVVAALVAISIGTSTLTCLETSTTHAPLADDAPVPPAARAWVAATTAACPDLPETWVAAVMAQESAFDPDAYADDVNGGTWGLFQLNASIWQGAYGHPWAADLNHNATWDIREPDIHARVAGDYLCERLAGVRTIRAQHPEWASSALPVLDALIIAHNAGESRLRTYPTIPAVTAGFIANVHQRTALWSSVPTAADEVEPDLVALPTNHAVPDDPNPLRTSGTGCLPDLGTQTTGVTVPDGTPHDVAAAVTTALSYVGVASGWRQLCDRLACRAYGYVGSGYPTARAHWDTLRAAGHARPDDTCPPLGSFVFFNTGRPAGHVSVVVQDSVKCDWDQTLVTSNEAFDRATGNRGGVYLLSLARLNAMYLNGNGYLGWTDPICAGTPLPSATVHPAPSGG